MRIDIQITQEGKEALMDRAGMMKGPFAGMKEKGHLTNEPFKILFDGGGTVLLRPSGIEPLMRCCLETVDEAALDELDDDIRSRLAL